VSDPETRSSSPKCPEKGSRGAWIQKEKNRQRIRKKGPTKETTTKGKIDSFCYIREGEVAPFEGTKKRG